MHCISFELKKKNFFNLKHDYCVAQNAWISIYKSTVIIFAILHIAF